MKTHSMTSQYCRYTLRAHFNLSIKTCVLTFVYALRLAHDYFFDYPIPVTVQIVFDTVYTRYVFSPIGHFGLKAANCTKSMLILQDRLIHSVHSNDKFDWFCTLISFTVM